MIPHPPQRGGLGIPSPRSPIEAPSYLFFTKKVILNYVFFFKNNPGPKIAVYDHKLGLFNRLDKPRFKSFLAKKLKNNQKTKLN